MHKLTKTFLHVWISLVSFAALASGWFFFAHAQKPAPLIAPEVQQITSSESLLEPIPTINDLLTSDVPSSPIVVQNPIISFPRLRTRGS